MKYNSCHPNPFSLIILVFSQRIVREHADDKDIYLTIVGEAKVIRLKKAEREVLFREWLPTSNVWDNRDESFVIEKFDGFRKRGVDGAKADQFHVVWKPRVFAADVDFPNELPEVLGLPWDEYDEDWMSARSLMTNYKRKKEENKEIIGLLEQLVEV
jgi:hypothetical protein